MKVIQQFFPHLSSLQIQQFTALKKLYENWNEKINVISRKDMENFYTHHVLHSLSVARIFQFQTNQTIMDLGTGGGFPGIPLAIFFPEIKFHLVDSINKKLKVAENIASQINLPNVNVQHTRAENIKDKKFDLVISRAVAPLKDLWEWSKPLFSRNADVGVVTGLVCLKGGELEKEISESGTRPAIYEIEKIFPLPYFTEKYILHVT